MKKILLILGLVFIIVGLSSCEQISNLTDQINQDQAIVFTLDELAVYNGKNGQKGYTAVNYVVYDVTNEFPNGEHQGFQIAGIDSTQIFLSSPHVMSILGSLDVVGVLEQPNATQQESTTTNNTTQTLPVFTLDELAVYNGQNGQKGYIAVDGVIYDVSQVFPNGMHQGVHLAGTDATSAFEASPHARSILNGLKIIGSLDGAPTINVETTTSATQVEGYMKVFSLDELAEYNGKNGQKTYVAVLGIVYDGSDEFYQGMHQGFQLGGIDATSIFQASPHAMSILNELPIVGSLEGFPLISINEASTHNQYDDDDDEYNNDDKDDGDHDDFYLNTTDLPQAALDYIQTNYPNIGIDEVELDDGMYEVELVNELELYFDLNGNFLFVEYDD